MDFVLLIFSNCVQEKQKSQKFIRWLLLVINTQVWNCLEHFSNKLSYKSLVSIMPSFKFAILFL